MTTTLTLAAVLALIALAIPTRAASVRYYRYSHHRPHRSVWSPIPPDGAARRPSLKSPQ